MGVMAIEIERKFLLQNEGWRGAVQERTLLRQGYLANTERCSVRVRVAGAHGWLSVKAMTPGIARAEYEVAIDAAGATEGTRAGETGRGLSAGIAV